jgi:hypothetical protein
MQAMSQIGAYKDNSEANNLNGLGITDTAKCPQQKLRVP